AAAAERVDRELPASERVTQFELLTAAALCAMHEAGVQIAVIEAGLGGRYDATSVIDARVTALTSIGLEHTRWLGETQREIAAETSLLQTGEGLLDAAARERAAREAAASVLVAGRLQLLDGDPPTVLDGAHNPAAVAALLESLPDVVAEQPLGLVFGVLDDKDAAGMLRPLAGRCERVWLTAPASERAVTPATLAPLARECGA